MYVMSLDAREPEYTAFESCSVQKGAWHGLLQTLDYTM
jgi:hypothetical protein